MAFVYRNIATGAVYAIAEKACLHGEVHNDLEAIEAGSSFQALWDRVVAIGAPTLGALSFNPSNEQFEWVFDVMTLVIDVDGVELTMNGFEAQLVEIVGDGTTAPLFTIKKKNLRDGTLQTAAGDNDTIQLQLSRGRLRDAADAQNLSEVTLVNGQASFRVRSVAETVDSRLLIGNVHDQASAIKAVSVPLKFV